MDSQPSQSEPRGPLLVARLLAFAIVAMAVVAVWFRFRGLANTPGVNGDEAWYGVKALEMLRDGVWWVRTPTGNPANPFYFGPLVLLHAWFPPSVVLLRSVAVAGGLAALVVNWLLCRWVLDWGTAVVSTMMLAVCPTMIAYSRFGWDASQSVLATLPVVYCSLAAVRFPQWRGRLAAAVFASLLAAVWVHPTNVFAGAVAVAASATWLRREGRASARVKARRRKAVLSLLALAAVGLSTIGCGIVDETAGRWLSRARGLEDVTHRGGLWHAPVLIARLHTGATPYRYIPGSQSWLEWPAAAGSSQWGLDVALFWAAVAASGVLMWRLARRNNSAADRVLLAGWGGALLAFLFVAGPSALLPGWERYGLFLIAPTTLVLARGCVLLCRAVPPNWRRLLLSAAVAAGWFVLADFDAHYFGAFHSTAGAAHATFRTGPVEPRVAALDLIADSGLDEGSGNNGSTWIITSEWWNYWPMKYLASNRPGFRVVRWEDVEGNEAFREALGDGRVWLVEFADGPAEQQAAARAAELGAGTFRRRVVCGHGGRALLAVVQVR